MRVMLIVTGRLVGGTRTWKPGSAPSRMSASTASTSPVEAARRSRRDAMSAVHSTGSSGHANVVSRQPEMHFLISV